MLNFQKGSQMVRNKISKIFLLLQASVFMFSVPLFAESIIADHSSVPLFEQIPLSVIQTIQADAHIYYARTSHGYQIITGIDMIYNENASYESPYFYEWGDDLGYDGDTLWVPATRTYLNSHPECNVAMFSWCGGVSTNTEEGINIYLSKMTELEQAYPNVTFVYMTGHLDGGGIEGNLYIRNNQIRNYCINNDKVLFDFADIESYDPDGNYYPDDNDACNWCYDWCAVHSCPTCGDCLHSHCLNCYLKGKAFWWMMAKIFGWETEPAGCGDANGDSTVNVSDAVWIANYVFVGGSAPEPLEIGDANCDGSCNVSDAVWIVNYIFVGGNGPCDMDGDGSKDC